MRRGPKRSQSQPVSNLAKIVIAVAVLIFGGCIISPPSLMDDVDAVQGQIARNMLQSGDWVTARLDGVAFALASACVCGCNARIGVLRKSKR